MCIYDRESTSTSSQPPTLEFTEYASPSEPRDAPENPGSKVYTIDVETALFTPTSLLRFCVGENRRLSADAKKHLENCRNSDYRVRQPLNGHWLEHAAPKLGGFKKPSSCLGEIIFSRVFYQCFHSGVVSCDDPGCQARRASLAAVAPACAWPALLDFVLTILSCWSPLPELEIIWYRVCIEQEIDELPTSCCIDLRGTFELCEWAQRLTLGRTHCRHGPLGGDTGAYNSYERLLELLRAGHEKDGVVYARRCREFGLCPNRLWNISLQSNRGAADIPFIAEMALDAPLLGSFGSHTDCTDQHCLLAHQPSTWIDQTHKCQGGQCGDEIRFPPHLLNTAFAQAGGTTKTKNWFNTAWNISETGKTYWDRILYYAFGPMPSLCDKNNKNYMAISHVWADGTGVGKKPNRVNACLYKYFVSIAHSLGCAGIWWDSVSIPTSDRDARTAAINGMLQNFELAKVTLIHDKDLIKFPWREDGAPAVALVLSTWFTRGWTAAELWASRDHPVKVLFADPDHLSGPPLIKDLDDDILAWDLEELLRPEGTQDISPRMGRVLDPAGRIPRQGHFIASDIIRQFRDTVTLGPVRDNISRNLSNFLLAMRPRSTSWPRDRIISAGLMCLPSPEFDSTLSTPQITRQILTKFEQIPITSLVHGDIPASPTGRWDWCPQSLFDLGQYFLSSTSLGQCSVYDDGRMMGTFTAYEIFKNDVIIPCGFHPAQFARVSSTLANRSNCLLLTTLSLQKRRLYILFQPVHVSDRRISGHWIACVFLQSPEHFEILTTVDNGKMKIIERRSIESYNFQFGNGVSHKNVPLPSISVETILLALDGFGRCVFINDNTRWFLSESFNHQQDISQQEKFEAGDSVYTIGKGPNWLPQQVNIYDINTRVACEHPLYRTREEDHPYATMIIHLEYPESQITQSLFAKLSHVVEIQKDEDAVLLEWSFPGSVGRQIRCENPQRRVFTSRFQLVKEIKMSGGSFDMSLGLTTFEELIKPNTGHDMSQGGGIFINTCVPCEICEACVKKDEPQHFSGMGGSVLWLGDPMQAET